MTKEKIKLVVGDWSDDELSKDGSYILVEGEAD